MGADKYSNNPMTLRQRLSGRVMKLSETIIKVDDGNLGSVADELEAAVNEHLKSLPKRIPYARDLIQQETMILSPEIRVWCHPHKVGQSGDDYYNVFPTFAEAETFIREHPEAEDQPLIAFAGKEINIYELLPKPATQEVS